MLYGWVKYKYKYKYLLPKQINWNSIVLHNVPGKAMTEHTHKIIGL